jgi:ATP-dependent Zn protease
MSDHTDGQASGGGATPPVLPSRPKESDRTTRKPMGFWDRVRVLSFLVATFVLLTWGSMSVNGTGFSETARSQVRNRWWLIALVAVEALRQLNYVFLEHSPTYYAWWKRIWDRSDRKKRLSAWTRYRLHRLAWVLAALWAVGLVIGAFYTRPDGSHLNPIEALFIGPLVLLQALPFILQLFSFVAIIILQFAALFWFLSRGGVTTYMPDDLDTRFSDVKGQDAVLHRVQENMIFLEDPESIERRGGYVPGGILLWGPPGTGKTLMAQAVAGETEKPFVFVEPGAFINMFMGVGILKVKGLYRKLRKLATRYGGVIVFFDEADALGNRGQMAGAPGGWGVGGTGGDAPWTTGTACNGIAYVSQAGRQTVFHDAWPSPAPASPTKAGVFMGGMMGGGGMGTLQALLAEMSGLKKPRGFINRVVRRMLGMKPKPPPKYRILHIFATNMPQSLDEAMLRPGRIDRIYKVGYPQKEGRIATLLYYLAKVQHELSDEEIEQLATITPYATGAMIQDMVNEGLVIAIRDGRETITWKDIIKAKQLKEHGLPDDHEYVERERHAVAVHEACHALVGYRLRQHQTIDLATIERRGDIGGFVSSIPPEDLFTEWRTEQETDVMMFLASLAGERLFFDGDHSTGVGGDLRGATAIATRMLAYSAMGDTIASRSVNLAVMRGAQPVETGGDRAMFDSEFGKTVETKLQGLYEATWDLLQDNRHEVLSIAHALEAHKTITGDDVAAVIEGRQGALVDGRPYADLRFARELEEYHAAAVRAHEEHGGVEGQLPIPVPPSPLAVLPQPAHAPGTVPVRRDPPS